jgi:WD40 repeat protein
MTSGPVPPVNGPDMRMPRSAWWSMFSHSGGLLYTCGGDPGIWAWDVRTSRLVRRIKTGLDSLFGPDLHPALDRLAAGGGDGTVRIWDVEAGRELISAARHRGAVSAVRFIDGGRTLASSGGDGTVRLTDAASGKRIGRLKRLGSRVHGLAACRTTPRFGAVFFHGVRVWGSDLADLFRLDGLYYHGGEGQSDLALPGDGHMLWVAFRREPYLRVWDLRTPGPEPVRTLDTGGPAFGLAFSHDEKLVAVALYREIVLVRAATCEVVARWRAPNGAERAHGAVHGLSFSPDGRFLASTDVAGGIWVWPVPVSCPARFAGPPPSAR